MADSESILQQLTGKFPNIVSRIEMRPAQCAILVAANGITEVFQYIKETSGLEFDFLSSISGVDLTEKIELVYFLTSLKHRHKLTVKTVVERKGGKIETISGIYKGANWFEREIWELYGVDFIGHPDLTRFLLPDDWDQGNPMLRDWDGKDFERMPS